MRPALMALASACALVLSACTDAIAPHGVASRLSPNSAGISAATTSSGPMLVSAMGATFCADLNGAAAPGVQTVLNSCAANSAGQQWIVPSVGVTGAIRVGELCVESAGGNGGNGDAIRLATCTSAANQGWTLSSAGELKGFSGRCISVNGASTAAGTRLVLWQCVSASNQKWTVVAGTSVAPPTVAPPATPPPAPAVPATTESGAGLVSAMGATFCADLNGAVVAGTPAVLNGCVAGAPGQQWTAPAVDATGAVRVGELCIESAGLNGANGDVLRLAACTTGANQRWTLTAVGELKGFTGRCISVDGASTAPGTRLIMWTCVGAANQKWTVRAAAPGTVPAPTPPAAIPPAVPPAIPATSSGMRVGYYVAPNGSSAGTGTAAQPWDLKTALLHPSSVRAGDTIWVRGGTYRGEYTSRLTGSYSAPIVVRQYPGERATVDGNLVIFGASTVFWGLEVMSSNTARTAVVGVNVQGARTRFVNMVVHDAGDNGFGFWSEAPDAEIYGSIIYNNGRMIASRGAGHGIYSQNRDGTKRIVDNVLFNQFAYGIHVYGSGASSLRGYHIEGNASFNSGSAAQGGGAPDLLVGGGSAAQEIKVASNYTYRVDEGTTAVFGSRDGPTNVDLALTGNYLVGSTAIMNWSSIALTGNTFAGAQTLVMLTMPSGVSTASYAWSGNRYHPSIGQWAPFNMLYAAGGASGYDLAAWQRATGLDYGSTLTRGRPTGVQVFVRPNRYEPGRANVVVYNWDRAGSVNVDATSIMPSGTRYEVRVAQDFYGAPVSSGTYYGGSINIPIRAVQPPTPIGGPVAPPSTGVDFNVYVIVPVTQ